MVRATLQSCVCDDVSVKEFVTVLDVVCVKVCVNDRVKELTMD